MIAGYLQIDQRLHGQVGLFFTDSPPEEVSAWFDDFAVGDFARAKHVATKTVIIPEGMLIYH